MITPIFWRRARKAAQALALIVFVLLIALSWQGARPILGTDALLRLDPLAAVAAMIAERRWLARFIPALVILAATLFLGRFWCGWLCPLGTLLDWVPAHQLPKGENKPSRWHGLKYGLLFVILFAALWGNLTLLVLDPLTIVVRSLGTFILPGLQWLFTQVEFALYELPFLRSALGAVDAALRSTVFSYQQSYYDGAWVLALLFGGILAGNLIVRRAWCRYLCPLGGLLSLAARASWLKRQVSDRCVGCNACARDCRMGAIDATQEFRSGSGECVLCMDCSPLCPQQAISFRGRPGLDRGWIYDPSRRQALSALGLSLGGLALLKIAPTQHHPRTFRLRPPGVGTQETDFLAACIRCGACTRTCPTRGLQPSVAEAGLEGLWTPILVPRLGQCDYSCNACGQICPSGAIPNLSLEDKRTQPIGKAYIDPKICIPWSGRAECIVCEEMCPLPAKAIILEEKEVFADSGQWVKVLAPVVLHSRCIGCGVCENKCPIHGEAAIRVMVDPMA